jgi:hypothetical protein
VAEPRLRADRHRVALSRAAFTELDHLLIAVHGRAAAAPQLATPLGVPWGPARFGPFSAVYLNAGLTLDFDEAEGPYPIQHHAFRVSPDRFDSVLGRMRPPASPAAARRTGPATAWRARPSADGCCTGTSPAATTGNC